MDTVPLSNKSIFKNSLPVAFAYIILGMTFGVLFSSKGGSPFEALIISIFCFAGAAQFVAIEFYRPDFSAVFMFVTIFILNIRHIFYGISFLNTWSGLRKIYLFSALTDENFGISNLYRVHAPSDKDWVKIYSLNHSYWVLGCFTGSLAPSSYTKNILGADFSLIALFIAIFASSMKKRKVALNAAHG
jgi:4-azaleucine resistance transporter AzlC